MHALQIAWGGSTTEVEPTKNFTFGRAADLVVGDDPFLHRIVGVLTPTDGVWVLHNVGASIHITIKDEQSESSIVLAPGRQVAVPFEEFRIHFASPSATYEMRCQQATAGMSIPHVAQPDEPITTDVEAIRLNSSQRLLLVLLAEDVLLTGDPNTPLPTNRDAAARLGLSHTAFNRKLDRLCHKFARWGVAGLRGEPGSLAFNRRQLLVQHVVSTGLITSDDLALIE